MPTLTVILPDGTSFELVDVSRGSEVWGHRLEQKAREYDLARALTTPNAVREEVVHAAIEALMEGNLCVIGDLVDAQMCVGAAVLRSRTPDGRTLFRVRTVRRDLEVTLFEQVGGPVAGRYGFQFRNRPGKGHSGSS